MQPTPDIAILWKKPDGSSCVLSKRGTGLFLSLQLFGNVQKEQAVESPREAMELAKEWHARSES
jgi:hypothetical protein